MPAIAISGNGVSVPGSLGLFYSPNPAPVTKTGNVRINTRAIIVDGDIVTSHSLGLANHNGATMVASQSAVRVNGDSVIINGDRATCSATHIVLASSGSVSIN